MIQTVILVISAIVHFIRVGTPSSVVFDEVYYGDFIANYWHGTFFFDIHPPFVKLFFSFVGMIFGVNNYSANWSSIGNALPAAIVNLRLIPMLAGIALPLVIYAICRRLNFSKLASFLASTLICLENSLIVQSRFILPDVIMLLVGFSSIWLYFEYKHRIRQSWSVWLFAGSTVLAAVALSIKWTGLTFMFFILLMEAYRLWMNSVSTKAWLKKDLKRILSFSSFYIVVALVMYASLFAVHFSILSNSGRGDVFMSESFKKTLIGSESAKNESVVPATFLQKFFELNKVMYTSNAGMQATHSYSSKWYTWPLMQRSVFYWQGSEPVQDAPRSYIYFLGNPFIYWLGSLAILSLMILGLTKLIARKPFSSDPKDAKIALFLIVGYSVNILPFIMIGRVMFLYHYMTSLVFSIIAIAFAIDHLKVKSRISITILTLLIALSAFIYWSPLTYGTPLTDKELAARMWLPSWR